MMKSRWGRGGVAGRLFGSVTIATDRPNSTSAGSPSPRRAPAITRPRDGYNCRMEITDRLAIPEEELTWTFARSGGPGGQNVNKVASKAVLRWDLAANTSLPADVRDRLRAAQRGRITGEGQL